MKIFFLFSLLFMTFCSIPFHKSVSNYNQKSSRFDSREFAQRCSLAAELAFDDIAAWRTSDLLSRSIPANKLDSIEGTWFVLPDNNQRLVFYGNFQEKQPFNPEFSFLVKNDTTAENVTIEMTPDILLHAKAVCTGIKRFNILLDSLMLDFSFNHYLRRNADSTFSMWFFPAGMDTYCAYGLEVHLSIDRSGNNVDNLSISGNELKYFEVTKTQTPLSLDNTYDMVPSVGNIFFVMIFGKYFKDITLQHQTFQTKVLWSSKLNKWEWEHTSNALITE